MNNNMLYQKAEKTRQTRFLESGIWDGVSPRPSAEDEIIKNLL